MTMWKNWLAKWNRRHTTRKGRPRAALYVDLNVEELEQRLTPAVGFGKATLAGATFTHPTSLEFGPDSRLYVAEQGGLIKTFTVVRNGADSYTATPDEVISLVYNIPNHNDDGTLNTSVVGRQVTGMLLEGTAANPVIYVTSSDPRVGGGTAGTVTGLDTNSGILSRLTWNGSAWSKLDLVVGLPRSQENHSANGMALDPATNTLFIGQGGNTNMGAPSNNFGSLPEYALSAAILSVDLTAIGNTTYNLPTLNDPAVTTSGSFGGDSGKHQAILAPGEPVQVYESGFRNPYDVIITQAGRMYAIDNGSNPGWGDVPLDPSGNPTTLATAGSATNAVHEPGVHTNDSLHLVTQGGYAGHPDPTRANLANTFGGQSPVSTADPVEGYFRAIGAPGDDTLTSFGPSTDGMAEYTASNFNGALQGDILATGFDNTVRDIKLDSTGTVVVSNTVLFRNVGNLPLAVTVGGGPLAGTIWVADYGLGKVIVFEPGTSNGTGADDPTLNDSGNHYSNHDLIANGLSPESAASVPQDTHQSYLSDMLNPDVARDGVPDTIDPFAIDASKGYSTPLPVNYPWDNSSIHPGGLLNLGFTGLMTDGVTNYQQLYDPSTVTAGGAAGVLTLDAVTAGTAKGAANTQYQGYQFGIDATPSTAPFVVHTEVLAPFAGLTPQPGQQIGLQFGTGDQDNYVELAIDGDGSVKLMTEVGGAWVLDASAPLTLAGLAAVDLYITVDPAGTVKGGFTTTVNGVTSAQTAVGASAIPTAWFSWKVAGVATAPAVGIMTTTGGGPSFTASYKGMFVNYAWAAGANLPVAMGEVAGGIINGKLYLVGEGNNTTLAYDLNSNTWTSTGLAQRPFVGDHQAAEVINGKLYLFGGLDGNSDGKVQSYDPVANTWTPEADMPWAGGSVSTALIGGLVYAAGGIVGSTTVSQAAVYNPTTNTWSAIASMPMGLNHSAAATDGSKFYIFGGRTGGNVVANGFNTVEIYDPATNTWVSSLDAGSTIPPLPQARGGMGKAVFYNGEFYVMGGETLNGAGASANFVYDRVDIYNPTTQTWRLGTPMPTGAHGIFPLLGTTAQGATMIYVAGGGTHSAYSQSTVLQTYVLAPPPAPAPTIPAAPTGLTAHGTLPLRVILSWQKNSANETGFQIERKTGSGSYFVLATVPMGQIGYTDVSVVADTQYTYRVTATNAAGNSAYTNEATVTPPSPTDESPFGGLLSLGGLPWQVPGLIQAEDFDNGGEKVGYHDIVAVNEGGVYRPSTGVGIQPTTDVGGGYNVGWVDAGEWLNYTVNVAAAGTYTLAVRVASGGAGGTFHVEIAGVNQTGELTVPNTGDFQIWTTISVPVQLSAGQQVLRVAFDTVGATGFTGNFNWFNLTALPNVPAAPSNLTATPASQTQVNLGWTDNSTNNETGFVIERRTSTIPYAVIGTVGAGVTSYSDTTALPGLPYTYHVAAASSAGNSAYSNEATATPPGRSPFGGTPWPVPGLIQAEDFDNGGEGVAYHDFSAVNEGGAYRNTGMAIQPTTDAGGGYNVGWVDAGEWVEYTVNVAAAGTYTLQVRVASAAAGGTFHVEIAGVDQTGALTVPNTGGWQTWTTLSVPVQLTAGQQVLHVAFDTVGATGYTGNFNWLQLTPAGIPSLLVAGFPSPIQAGVAGTFTVIALDASGNINTGYSGTIQLSSSDSQAVLPANYTFTPSDGGVHSFSVTLKTAGNQTLTATDTATSTITGSSAPINVSAAAATHFVVSAPGTATAGTAITFNVTALDQFNNTATAYAGTIQFTSSDGAAVLPANSTLSSGTFSATLMTAGNQTLTATDTATGSITGSSGAIAVSAVAATHFAVSAPGTATAGTAITFKVTALDQFNNPVTGYAGTVHFTSSDGAAVLPADSTLSGGSGTFSVTLKTAGSQTLTATDTATSSITGSSPAIAVSAAAASKLVVSAPASATAGVAFNFTVTAEDQFNNTATGYSGTVHFTSSDGAAVLPANSTLSSGSGTFSVTLKTAASQTLKATDTATSSITGSSPAIAVSAAAASKLDVDGPSTGKAGTPFTFTVTAQDQFNNTATGYSGTVHFTSSDGAAVLPADITLTSGFGTFSATLKTAGNQKLTGTDTATSSITDTSGAIAVSAAAATHFVVSAPGTATAGTAINFTVTALDTYGNIATGYRGTIRLSSSDSTAVLPANYTFKAGDGGKHTFSATLKKAGSQSLTATDTATSSITGAQAITVQPGVATSLRVAGFPSSIKAGTAGTFTVTVLDANGNIVTGYRGTIGFSSSDSKAVLPANYTFSAGDGGVHTFSATLKTTGTQSLTAKDISKNSISGTQAGIKVL